MASVLSSILAEFRLSANIINDGMSGTLNTFASNAPTIGAGLGQVNIGITRNIVVATGVPLDLDLSSMVDNGGSTIVFSRLTHYAVKNLSNTVGENYNLGGGANPILAADAIPIEAKGGWAFRAIPYNGITIDGTHKIFRISAAAGAAVAGAYMFLGRA